MRSTWVSFIETLMTPSLCRCLQSHSVTEATDHWNRTSLRWTAAWQENWKSSRRSLDSRKQSCAVLQISWALEWTEVEFHQKQSDESHSHYSVRSCKSFIIFTSLQFEKPEETERSQEEKNKKETKEESGDELKNECFVGSSQWRRNAMRQKST